MEAITINRRQPVQWYSLRRVALMLDFDVKTVRRWWREGKFGPPAGGRAEDYFFTVGQGQGADVRISARGVEHFIVTETRSEQPQRAEDVVVSGRSPGEAKREILRVVGG